MVQEKFGKLMRVKLLWGAILGRAQHESWNGCDLKSDGASVEQWVYNVVYLVVWDIGCLGIIGFGLL